jgi:ribosome biogenesis GTPase
MTVLTASGSRRVSAARDLVVAVGDWVTITPNDPPMVSAVLARRSLLRRPPARAGAAEQVVAANVDTVLLVTAVDGPLNVQQLERLLALAWQSGSTPVVVITKADLASPEKLAEWTETIGGLASGVAVHAISTATGAGMDELAAYLVPGQTVAVLGPSGAGKSTLVNFLTRADLLATGRVQRNGQGRHTTTHRELVVIPKGAAIIDTPGMRALSAFCFADVQELALQCEVGDCSHTNERGCAVSAAVASGQARLGGPDYHADRVQVVNGKRRKATEKAARRASRRAMTIGDPS